MTTPETARTAARNDFITTTAARHFPDAIRLCAEGHARGEHAMPPRDEIAVDCIHGAIALANKLEEMNAAPWLPEPQASKASEGEGRQTDFTESEMRAAPAGEAVSVAREDLAMVAQWVMAMITPEAVKAAAGRLNDAVLSAPPPSTGDEPPTCPTCKRDDDVRPSTSPYHEWFCGRCQPPHCWFSAPTPPPAHAHVTPQQGEDRSWEKDCEVRNIKGNGWIVKYLGSDDPKRQYLHGSRWVPRDAWVCMKNPARYFPSEAAARAALSLSPKPPTTP